MQGRLAVECDGDEWHGLDQWEQDVARQRMLERCGLEFWRVRGSTFYRDRDAALSSLWRELEHRGIRPEGESAMPPQPPNSTATNTSGASDRHDDLDTEEIEDEILLETENSGDEEPFADPACSPSGEFFTEMEWVPYRSWEQRPLPDPHTAALSEVMDGLVEIVRAEGPVMSRRTYALYNKAAGGSRLGRQTVKVMNRALYKAIRLGKVIQIVKGAGGNHSLQVPEKQLIVVRSRGPRRLEDIPLAEIAAVREAIKVKRPSYDEEQLVRRLADFYGIVRKTPQVRKTLLG